MPELAQFGFETEWSENAEELVTHLHQESRNTDGSLMATPNMHRYHCDCDHCGYDYALHAQTDSSCAGEIISRPFTTIEEARPVFAALQTGAVESDAVPGLNAGFHVHVDMANVGGGARRNALWEWIRWEDVIVHLARGRFEHARGNNRPLRDDLWHVAENTSLHVPWRTYYYMDDTGVERLHNQEGYFDWVRMDGWMRDPSVTRRARSDVLEQILNQHVANDRHSHLNIRTRYGTWEFRVWNSTRSAWRMELWCQMSRALVTPEIVTGLGEFVEFPSIMSQGALGRALDHLQATLGGNDLTDLADLVERQRSSTVTNASFEAV